MSIPYCGHSAVHSIGAWVYLTVWCPFVRLPAVPPINSSSGWFAAELWRVQQIGLSIDTAGSRAAAAGSVMLRTEVRVSCENRGTRLNTDL